VLINLTNQQIVDQLNLALADSVILDYRYALIEDPPSSGVFYAQIQASGNPIAQIALDDTTSVRALQLFSLDEFQTRETNGKIQLLSKAIEIRFTGV